MHTSLPALLLLFSAAAAGFAVKRPGPDPAVAEVAKAAQAFLAALPAAQQQKAAAPFGEADRLQWNFVPGLYAGVSFGELDAAGTKAGRGLLQSLLSAQGLAKTDAIVQLEHVLREVEGKAGRDTSARDPGRYTLRIYGEPRAEGTFAVRLQGHHLSIHCTCAGGKLAGVTPHFLGSNPHELRQAGRHGQRVLGVEEDLARGLLLLLDPAQRQRALLAAAAPPDVFLGPAAKPDALGERKGLPTTAMSAGQQEVLQRLCAEYAHNLRPEFAAAELQRIGAGWAGVHFAWAGGTERGQGHYWRIHGEHFAIEYDNTQNDANHVHTVWRDFTRDFGGASLRAHYAEHQHGSDK